MKTNFKIGEYVECISGCCEPGVIGRIKLIEPKMIWVEFSKSVASRHYLFSMREIKSDKIYNGDQGKYWSFFETDLRHTTKRRMSS